MTLQYIRTDIAQELELYESGISNSTPSSAGIDLYVAEPRAIKISPTIPTEIRTGLHLWIEHDTLAGLLIPRSSSRFRLTNTIGLIDSDYQGEYIVKALSNYDETIILEPGDKFAQLVLVQIANPANLDFIEVDNFSNTTVRGWGRNGSTGSR